MAPKPRAAAGFRAHSGWAAAVVVAGTPERPVILDRRRIEIADPRIAGSKQPYHAAEEMSFDKAKQHLERCAGASLLKAREAVGKLVEEVGASGHALAGCGLLLSSGRPLPALESVLASHALIHAADGEHFREALARAIGHHGLPVQRITERGLLAEAAKRFRMPEAELQGRVAGAGKGLGPPWTADQKLAALAGWLALAGG